MPRPELLIVTPALQDANNGNWQTASRWARSLTPDFRVRLTDRWRGEAADVMVALHARRSAASIADWAQARPRQPLVVVLTGTDLYRDIHTDAAAQRSLALADRLVVLHELAPLDLPPEHRDKARVVFQSCRSRQRLPRSERHLRALMVGHLRSEKQPQTYWAAAEALRHRPDLRLDHIGAALEPELGQAAQRCARRCPGYRWLGALPHSATRDRIQRAHVLVHPSKMEGGAHVVMEAITSGTPVLASRISGNLGLLGSDHDGLFEPGDGQGLATLLRRCRDEPGFLDHLAAQSQARADRFDPAREAQTLRALLAELRAEHQAHALLARLRAPAAG